MSATSMLQASRQEERAYSEIVDSMRQRCVRPNEDAQQLWRRLVFNLLITNTDDHLQNLGFLYDGHGLWRLAPAFDLNPMPNKLCESKTWLTEDTGPIDSVEMLLGACNYFALSRPEALLILTEVLDAVQQWRRVALTPEVGLTVEALEAFNDAFAHDQTDDAREVLGRPRLRMKVSA